MTAPSPRDGRHHHRRRRRRIYRPTSHTATLTFLAAVAAAAVSLPTAHGRSGADLVARFYHAALQGEQPEALDIPIDALTPDVKSRLSEFPSLSWGLLTGLQQRALLWDAGLVLTSRNTLAQILTPCSSTMADIMLDAQVVEQLVQNTQTLPNASSTCQMSNCGGNSRFLQYCPTDVLAAATRCVINTTLPLVTVQRSDGAFWAEDGGADDLPAPILRDHTIANATIRLFAIHLTPAPFNGMSACETMNRVIIPCRARTAQDTSLCVPAAGQALDAWLRFAAVPNAKTFSTTSAVLVILLLAVAGALAGTLYYVVQHKLQPLQRRVRDRRHHAYDGDSRLQSHDEWYSSSRLLSHEPPQSPRQGALPMDASAFARTAGGVGSAGATDPTLSNDALCTKSQILRRFVGDPSIVSKRISVTQLTFLRVLSKGGNGEVWLGQYESQYVALKCLLASKREDVAALERFTDEIRLASVLEHPRIVAFCGVAWQSLLHLCAVTEYLERGDLETVLAATRASNLTWHREKRRMAADIAEALVYLHSLSPIVIHRDLKSKNVLLDRHLRAKLSDFGLSRETSIDDTMTNGVGTILWSAPEVLEGKRYDEKADIFSFGIVLSEIDTCMLPYGFVNPSSRNTKERDRQEPSTHKMKSMQIVHLVAEGKLLPSFRDDCPPALVALARECLDLEPAKRPTAMEVVYRLRSKIFPLHKEQQHNDHEERQQNIVGGGGTRQEEDGREEEDDDDEERSRDDVCVDMRASDVRRSDG